MSQGSRITALEDLWPSLADIPEHLHSRLEADAKYSAYVERQAEETDRFQNGRSTKIAADFDYNIPGLSNEMREKFLAVRPATLDQATRIEGVTPAALAIIAARTRRVSDRTSSPPSACLT
jgi:tRNA uridine 5-carboxymethylaminomethyl modification enzyme